MTLTSTRAGTSERIRNNTLLLNHIQKIEADLSSFTEELFKIQKGMFFVSLYSCIEYTITNAVSGFLTKIQQHTRPINEYNRSILCIIMDREFKSLLSASDTWNAKQKLIDGIFSTNTPNIDNSIFPAPGTNISEEHFRSVWKHCGITAPEFPEGFNVWSLREIKNHRNAIAHGRETASSIGARFTPSALMVRHRDVELICEHTIQCFEQHILENKFFREN